MSHPIKEWVAAAPDARQRELRQAVHTVLVAVATIVESQVWPLQETVDPAQVG